jgi:phospholipid-binding lipoprotein MlaA
MKMHAMFAMKERARHVAWICLAAAFLLCAGCATRPNASPHDPFEPFNRSVTKFNEGLDNMVLKPVATAYRDAVPPLVRTGVSNFFGNLSDVWSFVNSVLQFKFKNAAENLMRVNVNTFFGLGGILDIASDLDIERHREDFGQTLGRWGVPAGPYIVLPLFGPSTLRDTAALPVDLHYDPLRQVDAIPTRNVLLATRVIDRRSNLLRAGAVLDEAALDKYSFTRDAYLQRRQADVYDGDAPDLPPPGATSPQGEPPAAPTK